SLPIGPGVPYIVANAVGFGRFASATLALILLFAAFLTPQNVRFLIKSSGLAFIYGMALGTVVSQLVAPMQLFWHVRSARPLTDVTFAAVEALLKPVLPNVTSDRIHYHVGTPSFRVEIGNPCSGFEGMGMILVFSLAWIWFLRREIRFPHAFSL